MQAAPGKARLGPGPHRQDARLAPADIGAAIAGALVFRELGKRGYRLARQIVVGVIGGTVVLVGVIMIVTPGPAFVVIPLGLAILAMEFAWARRWLNKLKASLTREQLNGLLGKTKKAEPVQQPPAE